MPIFLWILLAQQFQPTTIATDLKGGYQVLAVDLNRDGRPDLIALASGVDHLDWFENPGTVAGEWKRHVIASGFRQLINVAAMDIDGDGIPELLVAHEFSNVPDKLKGIVSLLRLDGTRRDIDAIPTSHRLKVANGAFINAPLADPKSHPPLYEGKIPLTLYEKGTLKPRLINDEDGGVMHGLHVTDWNGDGIDDLLTASFRGVHLLEGKKDGTYSRQLLQAGNVSDVTVAKIGKQKLLATIEPWHGNQFVIYTPERTVLDDTIQEGHTVLAADLDGDGNDEVIYGARAGGGAVRMAKFEKGKWTVQTILDGKIAANSCVAADLDGDKRPELICIGGATANLVIFTVAAVAAAAPDHR
ncbi:FG-GAP repeat domain-containing protein [Bryobacter aggregatus]|uniref:FG-GAP repeat domain-containing protein n=1 Tax=Bryobacter aggregatus TaxID=360054 RepID=UPI00068F2BEA|nr:VCBS repeat-containing protein [Bryobacter aggregatus]